MGIIAIVAIIGIAGFLLWRGRGKAIAEAPPLISGIPAEEAERQQAELEEIIGEPPTDPVAERLHAEAIANADEKQMQEAVVIYESDNHAGEILKRATMAPQYIDSPAYYGTENAVYFQLQTWREIYEAILAKWKNDVAMWDQTWTEASQVAFEQYWAKIINRVKTYLNIDKLEGWDY